MSARYQLDQYPSVKKDLRKINGEDREKLLSRVLGLLSCPFPHDYRHMSQYPCHYRIDEGEYRICYRVDDGEGKVILVAVGKRNDRSIYRQLRRRA